MSLNIITDTFITGEDRGLELANADWVRKFSWGNQWNRIRLGMHYTVTPNGTSNITNCILAFGICNGTDKPFGSTPDNWIGWRNPTSGTGTFQYNANAGNPYYGFTGRGRFTSIQSGSELAGTNLTTAGITISKPYTVSPPKRAFILLDIAKGSAAYTFNLWSQEQTSLAAIDIPPWRFGQQMTQFQAATDTNFTTISNSATVTANESTGDLDCMNVYWNEPTYPFRIHALVAVRYF
jgi:hypothetical protein